MLRRKENAGAYKQAMSIFLNTKKTLHDWEWNSLIVLCINTNDQGTWYGNTLKDEPIVLSDRPICMEFTSKLTMFKIYLFKKLYK